MVSRREFLRAGSIAGFFSMVPGGGVLAARNGATGPHLDYDIVVDTRFSEGDEFLSVAQKSAYQVHGVGGDSSALFSVLPDTFIQRRALIGLTPDSTLMIVEQLAMEAGYELNYQGIHGQESGSVVSHRIEGDSRWISSLGAGLKEIGDGWPALIGEFAKGLATRSRSKQELNLIAQSSTRVNSPGRLISWALLPELT